MKNLRIVVAFVLIVLMSSTSAFAGGKNFRRGSGKLYYGF